MGLVRNSEFGSGVTLACGGAPPQVILKPWLAEVMVYV
jgi:hypothetical protein